MNGIILVGGTGSGKSTLLEGLKKHIQKAVTYERRKIADEYIMPKYAEHCKENGIKFDQKNREHRFNATAWYAEQGSPGMGRIVESIVKQPHETCVIIDNLRGAVEVGYAIENIKGVVFIGVYLSDEIRLQRIIGRKDAFDSLEGGKKEKIQRARKIVGRESKNYNLKETFELLEKYPKKALVLNTERFSAEECLQQVLQFIEGKIEVQTP